MTKQERQEQLTREWTDFLSHPSVEHSLNVRLELTLKQRRDSDLHTARPRSEAITVRVQERRPGRRLRLQDVPLFAPFHYLTEDETRRIAVRVMNRLNRGLFGTAARRKNLPLRLTALVCYHDKGTRRHHDKRTRRHLHLLLALPPDVTLPTFRAALTHACYSEPFIYRTTRLEHVANLAASIRYNANDFKTLSQNSMLYLHTQPPQHNLGASPNDLETAAPDQSDQLAADDRDRVRPSHAG